MHRGHGAAQTDESDSLLTFFRERRTPLLLGLAMIVIGGLGLYLIYVAAGYPTNTYSSPRAPAAASAGEVVILRVARVGLAAKHPGNPAAEGLPCSIPEGGVLRVVGQDRTSSQGQWLMDFGSEGQTSVSPNTVYNPAKCPVGGQVFISNDVLHELIGVERNAMRVRALRDAIQRDSSSGGTVNPGSPSGK